MSIKESFFSDYRSFSNYLDIVLSMFVIVESENESALSLSSSSPWEEIWDLFFHCI